MSGDPTSQDPELLRRLLRAKDRNACTNHRSLADFGPYATIGRRRGHRSSFPEQSNSPLETVAGGSAISRRSGTLPDFYQLFTTLHRPVLGGHR